MFHNVPHSSFFNTSFNFQQERMPRYAPQQAGTEDTYSPSLEQRAKSALKCDNIHAFNQLKKQLDQAGKTLNLQGMQLAKHKLQGLNLKHTILDGANFSKADLTYTDFEGASLKGAVFSEATALRANFRHADLEDADFYKTVAHQADFRGARHLQQAKLDQTLLEGAKMDHEQKKRTRSQQREAPPLSDQAGSNKNRKLFSEESSAAQEKERTYNTAIQEISSSSNPKKAFKLWAAHGGHPDKGGDTGIFQAVFNRFNENA